MGWILLCGQIKNNDQQGTCVLSDIAEPYLPDYLPGFRGHGMEVGSLSGISFSQVFAIKPRSDQVPPAGHVTQPLCDISDCQLQCGLDSAHP